MNFLKVYLTPLQRPKIKFYIGRRLTFFPIKRIGFVYWDYGDDDNPYRDPNVSFLFFGFQITIAFTHPLPTEYWDGFLYYYFETEGGTEERLRRAIDSMPMMRNTYSRKNRDLVTYWDKIVRKRYVDLAIRETRRKYIESLT